MKFKNYIYNFITIFVSIFIAVLIINYALFLIAPQKILPRPLAGSLPNTLLTFYPDTYNKNTLNIAGTLLSNYWNGKNNIEFVISDISVNNV